MSFIAGLGAGFSSVLGAISDKMEGIVSTIINFFRNLANNVYVFFMKLWDKFQNDPLGFTKFLVNVYILML